MQGAQTNLTWDAAAQEKYQKMVNRIPVFHRELVKQVVPSRAEVIARGRDSKLVQEEDIVKAFLNEVPKAFYSLMIRLFDEVGFEYKKFTKG